MYTAGETNDQFCEMGRGLRVYIHNNSHSVCNANHGSSRKKNGIILKSCEWIVNVPIVFPIAWLIQGRLDRTRG